VNVIASAHIGCKITKTLDINSQNAKKIPKTRRGVGLFVAECAEKFHGFSNFAVWKGVEKKGVNP
jgi:hypothetical protein